MAEFSKGPAPYEVVLGLGSSTAQTVQWYPQADKLRTQGNATWGELKVAQSYDLRRKGGRTKRLRQKTPAEQAHIIGARHAAGRMPEQVAGILWTPH